MMDCRSKVCYSCNEERPESEYYRNVRMRSGRLNICRYCLSARRRYYYLLKQKRKHQRNQPQPYGTYK